MYALVGGRPSGASGSRPQYPGGGASTGALDCGLGWGTLPVDSVMRGLVLSCVAGVGSVVWSDFLSRAGPGGARAVVDLMVKIDLAGHD